MNEPPRLRDDGPDAVRALLRDAPKTRAMSADDRARTRARVVRAVGVAAGVGSLAWLQGAAMGAGLGVIAVGAAYLAPALRSPGPSSAPAAPAPRLPPSAIIAAAPSDAPAAPPPIASPPPRPHGPAPRPPVPPSPSASEAPAPSASEAPAQPPPRETDTLAEEAALLERARAALGSSPAEALAITESHAARFPSGKLGMERELVAIDALRRLGRANEARARGEAMLSRARGGLYEERIRKLLDGMR